MYGNRPDGIIDAQPFEKFHTEYDNHTSDTAKQDRAGGTHPIAWTRDSDQTSEKAVDGEAHIPLFASDVGVKHSREACSASSEGSVGSYTTNAFEIHRGKCASRIETIPAEPEQQAAASGNGEVVRHHGTAAVALELASQSRSENDRSGKSDETADRMNHGRAGEVVKTLSQSGKEVAGRSHGGKESIRTPGPVADDWVNEAGNGNAIEKVADESRTADHRSGCNRRAGVCEGELEKPKCKKRHARRLVRRRSIFQEEPVIADESISVTEHECESKCVEQQPAKAGIYDAFHQHVHGLTRTAEARFEHGEANLHSEHKKRSDERPHCVDGVDHGRDFDLWSCFGGERVSETEARNQIDHRQYRHQAQGFAGNQQSSVATPFFVAKPMGKTRELRTQRQLCSLSRIGTHLNSSSNNLFRTLRTDPQCRSF